MPHRRKVVTQAALKIINRAYLTQQRCKSFTNSLKHGCKKPVAEVAVLPEKNLTKPKIFGKIKKIL